MIWAFQVGKSKSMHCAQAVVHYGAVKQLFMINTEGIFEETSHQDESYNFFPCCDL